MTAPLTPDQAAAVERGKATGLKIAEARFIAEWEQIYRLGGAERCLYMLPIALERLAQLVHIEAQDSNSDLVGWLR
jgi:hypothetical protein